MLNIEFENSISLPDIKIVWINLWGKMKLLLRKPFRLGITPYNALLCLFSRELIKHTCLSSIDIYSP